MDKTHPSVKAIVVMSFMSNISGVGILPKPQTHHKKMQTCENNFK